VTDALTRRRAAVAVTLLAGATLLGLSLTTRPGSPAFVPLLLAVAVTWTVGGLVSGPLHLGREPRTGRRPVLAAVALGAAVGAAFVAGGALLRLLPDLRAPVVEVLDHARRGDTVLVGLLAVANGIAEEIFFSGAVYAAFPRRPVLASTAVYVAATVATGNPMRVLAGVAMGALFAWERRISGGVLSPILTHVVWTAVVIIGLPLAVGH